MDNQGTAVHVGVHVRRLAGPMWCMCVTVCEWGWWDGQGFTVVPPVIINFITPIA